MIRAAAPAGFRLSSPSTWRVDLRGGGVIRIELALVQGEPGAERSLAAPVALPAPVESAQSESLLPQIGGLLLMAAAGFVLVSGMALALILRLR